MQEDSKPDPNALAVPARNAKLLLERCLSAGFDAQDLLCHSGIDGAVLAVPGARISYQNIIKILINIKRLKIDSRIFMVSEERFSIASYGMLGYAMMSSDTLRQALHIALKYYRTSGPVCNFSFDFSAGDKKNEVLIQADDVFNLGDALLPLVIEDLFTGFPPLLKLLVGRTLAPIRVEFSYPEPAYVADYQLRFCCPLVFEAPTNRFVLNNRYLDLPLVQADSDAALMFEESCRTLLKEIESDDSLANRIRKNLLSSPGNLISADEMAHNLNMGTRTLRRRLAVENSSYQQLLDEVRGRIAIDYLKTTNLSSQEIAELLGYTEATNFRRAFIRWTGCSPGSYRKQSSTTAR